jgi:hypothetical protein
MNMNKLKIQDGVSYVDLWLGIIIGVMIGLGGMYLWDELEPLINPMPPNYVCQKGIAYQETEIGSAIYLKTGQACIDTRLITNP